MNTNALFGILALVYAGLVFFITYKKPKNIWGIAKIRGFEKVLGEKGTEIFFYAFGTLAVALGIWLMTK
ncbi:MAG: hypothetical protein GX769_01240 [Erysipelothrix sp.]|nr:hypothetical protein [Erysipelothrix sp.]